MCFRTARSRYPSRQLHQLRRLQPGVVSQHACAAVITRNMEYSQEGKLIRLSIVSCCIRSTARARSVSSLTDIPQFPRADMTSTQGKEARDSRPVQMLRHADEPVLEAAAFGSADRPHRADPIFLDLVMTTGVHEWVVKFVSGTPLISMFVCIGRPRPETTYCSPYVLTQVRGCLAGLSVVCSCVCLYARAWCSV